MIFENLDTGERTRVVLKPGEVVAVATPPIEPWTMTRSEYIMKRAKELDAKRYDDFTFSYDWRVESNKAGREHWESVRRALKAGKPVPGDVLVDYSMLTPQ